MIQRSVPGYLTLLSGLSLITARFAQDNTHIYDLGCALGASMFIMDQGLANTKACTLIGVDNSEAMLNKATQIFKTAQVRTPVSFMCDDITQVTLNNASIVVLNFD